MTKTRVLQVLRAAVTEAGSQKALAATWGLSASYLSDVLKGTRPPGPRVLGPMNIALGPRTYQRLGGERKPTRKRVPVPTLEKMPARMLLPGDGKGRAHNATKRRAE